MRRAEWVFALAIVVIAGAAYGLDRLPERRAGDPPPPAGRFLSLGWYCPLPPGEGIASSLSTVNLGPETVRLRRWAVGASKAGAFLEGDLPARTSTSLAASDLGVPDGAGVVEAFGSATSSDSMTLAPKAGAASSRCSGQPGNAWHFGTASTLRGRDTYLLVANPFEEEAVVKVRLLAPEGDVQPARLKDLVIPKLTQTSVFLAEYFRETERFGVEVVATRGRVVVSRYDKVSTREGFKGLSVRLGSREPSTRWYFAGGEVPNEGNELLHLANPGTREALVQVIFQTDAEQIAQPALQEVPVPAGRQISIDIAEHLPRGTRHGMLVASANRIPVVAERQSFGSLELPRGVESAAGVPATARSWVLSVGSPSGGKELLAVANFSNEKAVFRVSLMTADGEVRPPELATIAVDPGRRATIDLSPFLPAQVAAALVEAPTGGLVVERRVHLFDPFRDFADLQGQPL